MPSTVPSSGSIWKNRVYRKLFAAYTLASFGDWFDMLAILVLVGYVWKADPVVVALVPVAFAVPGVLFGSFAGVFADRWKKLNLMIIADFAAAILTVALFFAPSVPYLILIILLRAFSGVFKIPAHQALTRQIIAEDQILQATSYNGMVAQATKIIAPLVGASLLAAYSPKVCLMINAVLLLGSGLILLTIRNIKENRVQANEEAKTNSFVQDWKDGLFIILRNRILFSTMLFGFFGILALLMLDSQTLVVFREYDPENQSLMGWVMSCVGGGAVVSIMIMNRMKELNYGWVLGGGYLLIAISFAVTGLLEPGMSIVWVLLSFVSGGFGFGMTTVGCNYIFQKEAPSDAIGRVFGIQNSISNLTVIIAPIIGGWMVQQFGTAPTFLTISTATCLFGLAGIVAQRWIWPRKRVVGSGQGSVSA